MHNQNQDPLNRQLNPLEALKNSVSIYAEHRKLKIYSMAAGLAVIGFLALKTIFGLAISSIQPLQELVYGNYTFYLSLLSLFTIFSIGIPFYIAYLLIKQVTKVEVLPAGRAHNFTDSLLLIAAGFAACIVANIVSAYFSAYIKEIFNIEFSLEVDPAPTTPFNILLYFLCYAITPALIEEFALRGVVMQPLRKYGDWFAILMSSLVFALMHGNMTQVPFAFIAGTAIGFVVIKSGTLWTGIIVHFLNNASAVAQMMLLDSSWGEGNNTWLLTYAFYGIVLLIGGVCALIYFRREQSRQKASFKQQYPFSFPPKSTPLLYKNTLFPTRSSVTKYILTIPMLASIAIMIFQTIGSISF